MKSFVVPIDFSGESLNGLKMALLFSKKKAVDIQMVYVITKTGEPGSTSLETEQGQAEAQFKKIMEEYGPDLGKDSTLNYNIKTGRIYQQIVEVSGSLPNSVITTSTHGASGFQEFFIGSNTYRIISSTESPVITLRKKACPVSFDKIVLPIDLTSDTRQKVPFTTEIAKLFNAEIHILGIHTAKSKADVRKVQSYVSQVSGYIEGKAENVIHELYGDNVSDLIVNYAVAVDASMISITTERSSGISLIMGNTPHQILNKAECAVLCQTPKALRKPGTFVSMGG